MTAADEVETPVARAVATGGLGEADEELAEARRRLGAAHRRLGHAIVGHAAPIDAVRRLTAELEERASELSRGEGRIRVVDRTPDSMRPVPPDGAEMVTYDDRPISGRAAPWGLDLHVVRDGDEVVAAVTLGAAHEGAPGRCHGGLVSALFDDVFGFVLTLQQQAAFTGTLTIRYERGVPLHRPLECRVRLEGRERRKLSLSGELTGPDDDGETCVFARATAVFIAVDPSMFEVTAEA